MRRIAVVLASLVGSGQGGNTWKSGATAHVSEQDGVADPQRALAQVLLEFDSPAAAYHVSGPGNNFFAQNPSVPRYMEKPLNGISSRDSSERPRAPMTRHRKSRQPCPAETIAAHGPGNSELDAGMARQPRASSAPFMMSDAVENDIEDEIDVEEKQWEEDPRHAPLYTWLKEGGAEIGPIVLQPSGIGDGFGGFASRDIDDGEIIANIPTKACINTYDACGDDDVGDTLASLTLKGQGGATVALAISLAKEWLTQGVKGPRGPYMAIFPWEAGGDMEQQHVLYWPQDKMKDLEGDTLALRDAWFLREEVEQASRTARGVIGDLVWDAFKDMEDRNLIDKVRLPYIIGDAIRGAFVTILTRSFADSEGDDELEIRLVPLLDMCQHSFDSNIDYFNRIDEDTGEKFVEVSATRQIKKGEELFLNYNKQMTPGQFLSRFGFVPDSSIPAYLKELDQNRSFITNVMLNWPRIR